MTARVLAVHRDGSHRFSKRPELLVRLLPGLGVEGDAHAGSTVRHRSRVARDPTQPNLRQVHLLGAELLDELMLTPGEIGENVTTRGIDLLALPRGARLRLGEAAEVTVTGLRNPCVQLDRHRPGLMAACLSRDAAGGLVRRASVMAIVLTGGVIVPGDPIGLTLPDGPPLPLLPV